MMRRRPIGRLERIVEDAQPDGTRELIAREILAGVLRRFPHLSVEETALAFRSAVVQLRRADDHMSDVLADRPKLTHLSEQARASITRGNRAITRRAKERAGAVAQPKVVAKKNGRHRKRRSSALLDTIRRYQTRHPQQTNVARAYREIQPDISEKAFRGYWAAVERG